MINNRIIDILVIEDEMNTDLLTRKIKDEFKDNVRIHKNGHGLFNDLNLYKDLDLIIVDHQYTKEDLPEALRTIRKKSPGTEVVVLSSDNEDRLVTKIKEAGAYDYIYKDRSAVDKIVYVIRSFWAKKDLVKENLSLRQSKKKSSSAIVIMVLLIAAIIGFFIYMLTK